MLARFLVAIDFERSKEQERKRRELHREWEKGREKDTENVK